VDEELSDGDKGEDGDSEEIEGVVRKRERGRKGFAFSS
jgi:hypothetical protein